MIKETLWSCTMEQKQMLEYLKNIGLQNLIQTKYVAFYSNQIKNIDDIRKFEKKDINAVMEIWKNENIRAHNFIAKEYWKDNYEYVKDILPKADICLYFR